ncbi:pyridoxamine 5'-phosphate oxidase [Flagellimonas aquimarina]|jgi:predicted pyridoxine 5'-phosphate oxidase superfamily flavin-nucleotide-binding protein|uniref:Pyridoxamine 5'-phosphate oxidase n=1 Tax=Flagellimonas aquimarina TaxID=2201895 RepID=A0A316KYH9_9FLAO|nr:pyridoxamine 5'-phosphate oxidase family protein [Allomuricauda koreensis]PWL39317.1 pyridoxamine 5'-phosphate oxidase [Allomuricauda koreensis]
MNYAKLAFTDTIKEVQKKEGSRNAYERMEQMILPDGLSFREMSFIKERDSFYIASMGENGFPYIQHRGGPKGFLKFIDVKTLAFLDFTGNKQYITTGNVQTHKKVSLILMDYANRARLKIYAEAEVVSLNERPDLREKLELEDYKYKAERMFVFHIKAFDWNCPQHITPRYTIGEISEMAKEREDYIQNMEQEIRELKQRLENCGPNNTE